MKTGFKNIRIQNLLESFVKKKIKSNKINGIYKRAT